MPQANSTGTEIKLHSLVLSALDSIQVMVQCCCGGFQPATLANDAHQIPAYRLTPFEWHGGQVGPMGLLDNTPGHLHAKKGVAPSI